jgi:hypothetical protein
VLGGWLDLPMTKTHILDEIRRTAEANSGKPLGRLRFEAETGIRLTDWSRFWARWGDAVREAGFAPNEFQAAYKDAMVLDCYAKLARDMGRLPAVSDLRLKARNDSNFPSHNTFQRLGSKLKRVRRLAEYCRSSGEYDDVVRLCEEYVLRQKEPPTEDVAADKAPATPEIGFIYLMKSGRFYKIGRSNSAGRREYELGLQLPEPISMVHAIRTDDPVGIEAYWHKRFEAKRKNGEWFELDTTDVAAFRRRKFM